MQTHGREAQWDHPRPHTRSSWESSHSSGHCPFPSDSHFKQDCSCFSANNSLKASLSPSHNGPILQQGRAGVLRRGPTPSCRRAHPSHDLPCRRGQACDTSPSFKGSDVTGQGLSQAVITVALGNQSSVPILNFYC